jgi:deazaflavin-dependent oxidoreductase (nitroreductase family)
MGWYRRLLVRIGHTRAGVFLIEQVLSRVDRRLYRWTNGKLLMSGPMIFPTLLLTTIGRTSGKERTVPLIYVRDGARLVVVTGYGGTDQRANWAKNLAAHPVARVQVGEQSGAYRAHLATEDEWRRYWPELVKVWPPYETYRRRSGGSKVFVLEPVGSDAG